MIEQFEDTEVYPVEASADSSNAYYLPNCNAVNHRPAFAVCLHKIDLRRDGRLETQYAGCSAAIGGKTCQAIKLRKEELDRGQAIYFTNRNKMLSHQRHYEELARDGKASSSFRTKAPKKSKHFLDEVPDGSYADALNAALAKEPTVVKESVVLAAQKSSERPVSLIAPVKAGMSLLEMARMQFATKP